MSMLASGATVAVREDNVRVALSTVIDPELAMSIVDLGLIYEIQISGGRGGWTPSRVRMRCPGTEQRRMDH